MVLSLRATTASGAGGSQVLLALEAIKSDNGRRAAFEAMFRAREGSGVPSDFSVGIGALSSSKWQPPTPPPTPPPPGDASSGDGAAIGGSVFAVLLVGAAAAAFVGKRRRWFGAASARAPSSKSDGSLHAIEMGAVSPMTQNPGFGGGGSDDNDDDCAAVVGVGAAVGAAMAVGLVVACHLPVISGIATIALQLKTLYDKQLGGPANAAAMSKWATHLAAVMKQLPPELNASATAIATDVKEHLDAMLIDVRAYDRQGKLRQWMTSVKCREQQQDAQAHMHRLLSALQLGVAGESLAQQIKQMDVALGIDAKVDALLQQSQRRSEQEERQHMRDRAASAFAIARRDVQVQLDAVLGRGGAATVYKAQFHGDTVAAKVVDLHGRSIAEQGQIAEAVHRELALMTRLQHKRIVRVLGMCECRDKQQLIMLMDLAEGGTLRALLDSSAAPIDVGRAAALMHDTAVGLAFLHSKKVLHRDVKSLNLLLDGEGRVLVSDFGISKSSSNATTTVGGAAGGGLKGSMPWLAPEHIQSRPFTQACDVYGFGIVVWEVLSRQVPWAGCDPAQIIYAVTSGQRPPLDAVHASYPAPLVALMQECWAHDAAERPSFADIASRLGTLVPKTAPARSSKAPRWSKSSWFSKK